MGRGGSRGSGGQAGKSSQRAERDVGVREPRHGNEELGDSAVNRKKGRRGVSLPNWGVRERGLCAEKGGSL